MKLEVGKKYVDGDRVYEYVGKTSCGVYCLYNAVAGAVLHFSMESVWECLKPYTPPRPDVEVLGDLIERVRYSQTCLPQETIDLLREAEKMKKRMEE